MLGESVAAIDRKTWRYLLVVIAVLCLVTAVGVAFGAWQGESALIRAAAPKHDPAQLAAAGSPVVPAPELADRGAPLQLSPEAAARFLIQATYGPTPDSIRELQVLGYDRWLQRQIASQPADTHWAYLERKGPPGCNPCKAGYINAVVESYWRQVVLGEDQLRQRMAFALSEIFVVSTVSGVQLPDAYASYLDMLNKHALGNFRDLLEAVTLHPTMGEYLSHKMNRKEDRSSGRTPDENFAREVMQLFSIGLWELNEDGTRKTDAQGRDIPTYDLADVMGMAKVMTGLSWGGGAPTTERWHGWVSPNRFYQYPMQFYPEHHSTSEKKFLGKTIPATREPDGPGDLKVALDTLFRHPNVGPFIGEQLIKRFVTSNPSPAYVSRVARVFADNGQGVRGDLAAVIRQVLMDPEARDPARLTDPKWGKLREPVIRYANYLRAFTLRAKDGVYAIWNTEDDLSGLAQNIFRSPSVFNWFRPNFSPPGVIADNAMVAPEFQMTDETTSLGYISFMSSWRGIGKVGLDDGSQNYLAPDWSVEKSLVGNPKGLVERLNLLLLAGQMREETKSRIVSALQQVRGRKDREDISIKLAILLTMSAPEYIVQK